MILICMFTSIFNSFSFVDQSGVILVNFMLLVSFFKTFAS